ncbi:uncharacterized protein EI97DRAFT_500345 [Westerdykella ornata]|uniref:Uncharacterized protein n=1 Tax=Westerdykella ornata TaxID=318751 RepID=A0A6A6JMB3_WESOR|nr:uncharacterized protein EI97DRAFT_500345 [Westerdykella ornata]KAF2277365.1 hypothetical protein EI97DRAFT_500345 [Westerdykella ornata]
MPRTTSPRPQRPTIDNEYNVVLEKPFAATFPSKRIEIIGEPNRDAQIKVTKRSGEHMQDMTVYEGHLDREDSRELYAMMNGLRGFPANPNKDVYGLDTRLSFTTDMQFDNGGEETTGELTEEQRYTFRDVCDSVEALGRLRARRPSAV